MSRRPGFLVNHNVLNDGGRWPLTQSPNKQPDRVSVEIRCYWPYTAPKGEVVMALGAAVGKALAEIRDAFGKEAK